VEFEGGICSLEEQCSKNNIAKKTSANAN